eukprot:m.182773 g.182773  ORF g.182773 m.182773 type:complete len:476 (-) comp15536_c0_seq3:2758-4185(-)
MSSDKGIYRSLDQIKNLRIRVKLKKVALGSKPDNSEEGNNNRPLEPPETMTVAWQQKLFSVRELDTYKLESNCTTVLEKTYHEMLTQQQDNVSTPLSCGRFFTFTDQDEVVNSKEGPNTFRRVIDTPFQVMYLMADLRQSNPQSCLPDESLPPDEKVLCKITYDANNILEVQPNFNQGTPAYHIKSEAGELFEYTLQHVSAKDPKKQQEKDALILKRIYDRKNDQNMSNIGNSFETARGQIELFVFGQLEHATDFDYDDLSAELIFELPAGWELGTNTSTTKSLRSQTGKKSQNTGKVHFSHAFELHLVWSGDDNGLALPQAPLIYVQLKSDSHWGTGRVEGYGYIHIPIDPGIHTINVTCWRPCPSSQEKMRRFFIGGGFLLEDSSYPHIPAEFDGEHVLSKFGFVTTTSGTVQFRLNVVKQTDIFSQANNTPLMRATPDVPKFQTLTQSTAAILDAFERTKRKSEAVLQRTLT